jgi:putative flippase GtrA
MPWRRLVNRGFITYVLVGILNTIFGYSVFAILIYLKLHYSLAVLLSTVLGVLFNFKTIGKLVFKSNDNRLIFRFISVYVIVYLMNVAGLKIYRIFDDNMYLAGLFMIFPTTIFSFVMHKRFVFKERIVKCR